MTDGKVFFARSNDHLVLRFDGDIRYTLAYSLDRFLDRQFAGSAPKSVCVDLNDTLSIDSTGIGLLAKIAKLLGRDSTEKPVLFSGNEDINELLRAVCLDRYCVIVPGTAQEYPLEALSDDLPQEPELAKTVLEAHRTLCELSEGNRRQFRSVVEALERERY